MSDFNIDNYADRFKKLYAFIMHNGMDEHYYLNLLAIIGQAWVMTNIIHDSVNLRLASTIIFNDELEKFEDEINKA